LETRPSQERPLERGGRALERLPEHGDDDLAAVEGVQRLAHPLGTGERVVLRAALGEARGGVHVVVGAEGHHEEVGVVRAGVGRDPTGGGIDPGNRLLAELDAVLGDVAVGQPNVVGGLPTEHDIELREAEVEGVVTVQQRDADGVRAALGQPASPVRGRRSRRRG
jgi:hypothetical protein